VGEITGQIEQEIVNERRELGRSLDELGVKARELADWRTHYRNHPRIALGVVFGAALVAGVLAGGRRNGAAGNGAYGQESWGGETWTPEPARAPSRARREVSQTWDRVWSALLGLATAKAVDLVGNYVPGFREQYENRQRSAASAYGHDT
jgi:hypothetical protein